MRVLILLAVSAALASCSVSSPNRTSSDQAGKTPTRQVQPIDARLPSQQAVRNFQAVVRTVEPVAEQVCRERTTQVNCDFRIVVDDTVNAPPNAFQTVDRTGRPIIAFTVPLIAITRNTDELAFIMAHEAAHHVRGHLARARQNANIGATIAGAIFGGDSAATQAAQQLGAAIGARSYSKDFELEADALGTVIAARAGYDPVRGAQFFNRIPDPGNRFLGTHPANADRLATVQRVAAGL